jgi:N-acetylglucosamine transport system substrate-binding protein
MKSSNKVIFRISGLAMAALLTACNAVNLGADSSAAAITSRTSESVTSGTSKSSGSADEIWICVYDGGYGTQWLADIAASFTAKTGIKVHYDADTSILDRIENALKNGGDYDIYMSHGINWQSYAASGWLANLDDLYSSSVDGFSGTFTDRLANGAANLSKITGKGDTEGHYYKVCYTQGAGGFVYNVDMFKNNGWSIPTTYDELKTLCTTILNAKVAVPNSRATVVPFSWSGKDRQYYWDYPMFEWWYQLAGADKINAITKYLGPDGKYADGYEMYNPASYYSEFMQAYDMWWNLIANDGDNFVTGSYSTTLAKAQANFVNQEAAMIPYAQWAKYELSAVADGGTLPFNIAMMKTPKATSSAADCNYMVGFGDSMVIPANSPQIANAKKFINYLATAEACKTFVKDSNGAFLAFDYNNIDLSDLESTDTFIKSIHEKLRTTDFSLASTNPITYRTVNCVMPWVSNVYYYQSACTDPASYTSSTVGPEVYSTARQNWPTWLNNSSLKD